jgi:hypothetical protein
LLTVIGLVLIFAPSAQAGASVRSPKQRGHSPRMPTAGAVPSDSAGAVTNEAGGTRHCQPSPSTAIAAGGVWNGAGKCYNVRDGVTVSTPVTVENATFFDSQSTPPRRGAVLPIMRIKDTSNVTVENVTLNGQNIVRSGGESDMAGESGIQVLGSSNVTLDNISVNHVYGDGLTLGFQPRAPENTNINVTGYHIDGTGVSRQGVTVAYVNGATFNGVTIADSAGWDFESDVAVGSGNVTVNNYQGTAGVRLVGALSGPVTFNHSYIQGDISLRNAAALSNQPVTFNGGIVAIRRTFQGTPPAGVWVRGPGGNLTLNGMKVARQRGTSPATGPAWSVTGGGHLTLANCAVLGPPGTNDASSTVTVTP